MDPKILLPLKSRFVTREVGDELVLVPLTGNVSQMKELFTMNGTGRIIWENISEDCTVDGLVLKIKDVFDVTEEQAKADLEVFLAKMYRLMA